MDAFMRRLRRRNKETNKLAESHLVTPSVDPDSITGDLNKVENAKSVEFPNDGDFSLMFFQGQEEPEDDGLDYELG